MATGGTPKKRTPKSTSLLTDELLKGQRLLARLPPARRKKVLALITRNERAILSDAISELKARVDSGKLLYRTVEADLDETFDNVWDMYLEGGVHEEAEACFPDEEQDDEQSALVDELRTVFKRLFTAMAEQHGVLSPPKPSRPARKPPSRH
ncbi:hypothetical protein HPC49_00815 [Pyxidicoccus fallax]|uniref:Uncharacterized protein n=1 Tax=Pyxidicoccus fallax TaxID=394095 RepID=A0A848LDC6_9BACT|nr:hypothetical protein [Pyxidicoccus fallax]NMO14815.1 hypothetical protein [Pyxidicoccus fallax]NPC76794.1 hypothetical protein [Pyxidicoccus fallax]